MISTELLALITASIALITSVGGIWHNRRSTILQARRVHESVTEELIRQRIVPYAEFLSELEFSSSHNCDKTFNDESLSLLEKALHSAIYGKVGLLATHVTRQLLVYTRLGCDEYHNEENVVDFDNLMNRRWVVLAAMRSDLGIAQPAWDDVLESIGEKYAKGESYSDSDVEKLVIDFSNTVGKPGHFIWPCSRQTGNQSDT